jgi:hypothetical protein
MWSTRRLNDMDPLPLVSYASGADATGYPRPGDPITIQGQSWAIPERRPAGGMSVDRELGNYMTYAGQSR